MKPRTFGGLLVAVALLGAVAACLPARGATLEEASVAVVLAQAGPDGALPSNTDTLPAPAAAPAVAGQDAAPTGAIQNPAPVLPSVPGLGNGLSGDMGSDGLALVLSAAKILSDNTLPIHAKIGLFFIILVMLGRAYLTRKKDGVRPDEKGNYQASDFYLGVVGLFCSTSEGGTIMLLLLTFLGTFGATLYKTTGAVAWGQTTWTAVMLAIVTAGGWHVVVKPIWERAVLPFGKWLLGKITGKGTTPPALAPKGFTSLKLLPLMFLVAGSFLLALYFHGKSADAAQPSTNPRAQISVITLDGGSAARFPASCLAGRTQVKYFNGTSGDVLVGQTAAEAATGWPIATGTKEWIEMSCDGTHGAFWIYSSGGGTVKSIEYN